MNLFINSLLGSIELFIPVLSPHSINTDSRDILISLKTTYFRNYSFFKTICPDKNFRFGLSIFRKKSCWNSDCNRSEFIDWFWRNGIFIMLSWETHYASPYRSSFINSNKVL